MSRYAVAVTDHAGGEMCLNVVEAKNNFEAGKIGLGYLNRDDWSDGENLGFETALSCKTVGEIKEQLMERLDISYLVALV